MFKTLKKREFESEKPYVIEVKNVSKSFKIPHEKRVTVYDNLIGKITGKSYTYEVFEALKEVSFNIKEGETFGIIGENGSGKSTILKIISKVLVADIGSIKVKGKMAPFLELGVGFQPDLTAVENVYLYGAIMGMNHTEMDAKLDSIFEFAELDRFRDTKIKNFSSGMYARLAFATAISIDPDVLLIDEVLSVGDQAFQAKCHNKISEYKRNGKTIVFVSHSMEQVREICDNCLMISHGKMVSIGPTENVISDYLNAVHKKEVDRLLNQYKNIKDAINNEALDPSLNWGSKEAKIIDIKFFNNHSESYIFQTGEKFIARIKYKASQRIEKPVFGIAIYKDDFHITGPNTKLSEMSIDFIEDEGEIDFVVDKLPLLDGSYRFSAAIYDDSCQHPYDHQHCTHGFEIKNLSSKNYGVLDIRGQWLLK
ncbi:MAG: lipopolysaccharide transport system ATP-binding protein [Euryarchaeota archaeon]|nr:lipopolysaccharide transport system ATP-binding protein [Euryarchaeota archaeon]